MFTEELIKAAITNMFENIDKMKISPHNISSIRLVKLNSNKNDGVTAIASIKTFITGEAITAKYE